MPDHVHILVGMRPSMAVSDLVRDIKAGSSNHINKEKLVKGKFSWQEGHGSFSHSKSQINQVANYIANQEEHHRKKTFKEEYLEILDNLEIEYDERYIFDWIE